MISTIDKQIIHVHICMVYWPSGQYGWIWTEMELRTMRMSPISSRIIWLAPRAGKMNQIARCDWLPEWARWSHLARLGLPAVSRMKNFAESHIINPLLTKFVRSRWLDIGLVLLLWEKNLANIQPSWPLTWSITHTTWQNKLGQCRIYYIAFREMFPAGHSRYCRPELARWHYLVH